MVPNLSDHNPSKMLPRHQLRVRLALRKLRHLLKSQLIPVHLQLLRPRLRLELHQQLLIRRPVLRRITDTCSHYLPT